MYVIFVIFLFHNRKGDPCNWLQSLQVGNEVFPRVPVVKYIGMHVDEKLTWKNHIQEVYNSLKGTVSGIK